MVAVFASSVLSVVSAFAADDVVVAKRVVEPFELSQVRLLPSPFKRAQEKNCEYLLSVEPDRLLARIRKFGGIEPRASSYGGWEAQGIAGHSLGHYLSALSKSYASTGDVRFKERAEYVVSELAACQEASNSGMLIGDERARDVFKQVASGDVRSKGFDLNGLWVPWYAMHKIFAGLLDAYKYCDDAQALEVAKTFGDWGIETIQNLSFEQMQKMLRCEHGGMNESYYNLYAATGDKKYLQAGDRFYDLSVLKALSEGRDELEGKHANTQIPKLIGLARRAELVDDELNAFETANFFWDRVVHRHSYVIGGHSSAEHFGAPDVLSTRLTNANCETCNTYNMLKLTKELYVQTGKIDYMNFAERALYNHILASLDPSENKDKLYTYFVPLQPGSFRTYSTRETHWTCCHGTGMENHAQYNGQIYYREKKDDGRRVLYVNLLIPSTLDWSELGVKTTLDSEGVFTVEASRDVDLTVKIRVPNNCRALDADFQDGYATIGDSWKKGATTKRLNFVADWKVEPTPDNPNMVAFLRGPIVYAGDLGSVDAPLTSQFDLKASETKNAVVLPVVVSESREAKDLIDDAAKETRSFFETPASVKLTAAKPETVDLVPFYAANRRYDVYFDVFDPKTWKEKEEEFAARRAKQIEIDAKTISYFQPGEMQPERDANFECKNSAYGEFNGRKWRHASGSDGYFEFDVKVDPNVDCALVITYWGSDVGARFFDILVDGEKIAERRLNNDRPGKFFNEAYPLPNPEKKSTLRVRFQCKNGETAGGIFGARTIPEKFKGLVVD